MKSQLHIAKITIASAWSTLQILDRQARKDCTKITQFTYGVYLALTSRRAKQTYRMIRNAIAIVWAVLWAVWVTLEQFPDQHLEHEPIGFVPNPDEPSYTDEDRDLVTQHYAYICQYWHPTISDNVVPFIRKTPQNPIAELTRAELLELAQQRELPNYKKMSTERLRRKLAA